MPPKTTKSKTTKSKTLAKKKTKKEKEIKYINSITAPKYRLPKNATWDDIREHKKYILGDD